MLGKYFDSNMTAPNMFKSNIGGECLNNTCQLDQKLYTELLLTEVTTIC